MYETNYSYMRMITVPEDFYEKQFPAVKASIEGTMKRWDPEAAKKIDIYCGRGDKLCISSMFVGEDGVEFERVIRVIDAVTGNTVAIFKKREAEKEAEEIGKKMGFEAGAAAEDDLGWCEECRF